MASRKQELVGIYLAEKTRFADSGTAVLLVQVPGTGDLFNAGQQIEVKIKIAIGELEPQLSYRFYGTWGSYFSRAMRKDVEQFNAETYTAAAPHGKAGIVRYLTKAPHVAYGRAEKLYAAFGSEAVATLRTDPEQARLVCDPKFSAEQANEAAVYLRSQAAMEHCEIDLMDVLDGKGFPRDTPKKAVKKWGNKAAEVIRSRPYKLMTFRGCGFLRTDATDVVCLVRVGSGHGRTHLVPCGQGCRVDPWDDRGRGEHRSVAGVVARSPDGIDLDTLG